MGPTYVPGAGCRVLGPHPCLAQRGPAASESLAGGVVSDVVPLAQERDDVALPKIPHDAVQQGVAVEGAELQRQSDEPEHRAVRFLGRQYGGEGVVFVGDAVCGLSEVRRSALGRSTAEERGPCHPCEPGGFVGNGMARGCGAPRLEENLRRDLLCGSGAEAGVVERPHEDGEAVRHPVAQGTRVVQEVRVERSEESRGARRDARTTNGAAVRRPTLPRTRSLSQLVPRPDGRAGVMVHVLDPREVAP